MITYIFQEVNVSAYFNLKFEIKVKLIEGFEKNHIMCTDKNIY